MNYTDEILGIKKAELVLKNARLVNVISDEVKRSNIAISNGVIVGIGEYFRGKEEIDLCGKFVCPGFIDAHLYPDASLIGIGEFDKYIAKAGTTTYISDLSYILPCLEDSQLEELLNHKTNAYFSVPLCDLPLELYKTMYDNDSVISLSLSSRDDLKRKTATDILSLFENKTISALYNLFEEKSIEVFTGLGASIIHDCQSFEQAIEAVRRNAFVSLREGSYIKNSMNIVRGAITNFSPVDKFIFCTDHKNISDIKQDGHIAFNIRKAINAGLNPVYAVKMATINVARAYGLKNVGAIAPGKQADMVILNDLTSVDIDSVYIKGKLLKNDTINTNPFFITQKNKQEKKITNEQILIDNSTDANVIRLLNDGIMTFYSKKRVCKENDSFLADAKLNKVVVTDNKISSVGASYLENFGINNGAVATSISIKKDIIVIGDNDSDIILATNTLLSLPGGVVIVKNGKVVLSFSSQERDILSFGNSDDVSNNIEHIKTMLYDMDVNKRINPFAVFNLISYPMLPKIRLTPKGLYDVFNKLYID